MSLRVWQQNAIHRIGDIYGSRRPPIWRICGILRYGWMSILQYVYFFYIRHSRIVTVACTSQPRKGLSETRSSARPLSQPRYLTQPNPPPIPQLILQFPAQRQTIRSHPYLPSIFLLHCYLRHCRRRPQYNVTTRLKSCSSSMVSRRRVLPLPNSGAFWEGVSVG